MAEPNHNPRNGLLQTLAASGDKWVQLVIVVLVAVSGGGNFFATQGARTANILETDRAIAQIKDIHGTVQNTYVESITRQKEILETIKRIEAKLDAKK